MKKLKDMYPLYGNLGCFKFGAIMNNAANEQFFNYFWELVCVHLEVKFLYPQHIAYVQLC